MDQQAHREQVEKEDLQVKQGSEELMVLWEQKEKEDNLAMQGNRYYYLLILVIFFIKNTIQSHKTFV